MSDLPPLPAVATGHYRHYKGRLYALIGVVRHSETLEPLALYQPLYGEGALWVRPWAMFFDSVVVDGRLQRRFAPVNEADVAAAAAPAAQPSSS